MCRLSKLFDSVLLKHISARSNIADILCGFQTAKSPSLCTNILKRTVSYFTENGSHVSALSTLRRTFDFVNFWTLFIMLLSANIYQIMLLRFLHVCIHISGYSSDGMIFCLRNFVRKWSEAGLPHITVFV